MVFYIFNKLRNALLMSMKNESQTVTVSITVKYAWKLKNNTKTTGITQQWFCFMKFSTVRLFVCMPFQLRTKAIYENYKQQQDTESKKRTDE